MIEGSSPATEYAARRRAERRREQRVLGPALIISAVVHVVVLLVLGFHTDSDDVARRPAQQVVTPAEPVMQAYDIAAVTEDVAPIDAQVRERELLRAVEVPAERPWVAPQIAPPAESAPAPAPRSPHDRLQYRMGSTEIWKPGDPIPSRELSDHERVEERVASQLREYNDSVAAENAARTRALDWTKTDSQGRKWGASNGVLHLGSIKINVDMPLGDELKERNRTWTEIQIQANRAEVQEIFDERVRAIRERVDQERNRQNNRGGSTAGPTPVPGGGGSSSGSGQGGSGANSGSSGG